MISKRIFNLLESIKYDEAFKFLKESIKEEVRVLVDEYEKRQEIEEKMINDLYNYINSRRLKNEF